MTLLDRRCWTGRRGGGRWNDGRREDGSRSVTSASSCVIKVWCHDGSSSASTRCLDLGLTGPEGQQSIKEVTKVAAEHEWYICENQIRYSASYAKSAREGAPLSQTSYARGNVVRDFNRLANEVFDLIGVAQETE